LFKVNGMADSFQASGGAEQKARGVFRHQTLRIFCSARKSCQCDDLTVAPLPAQAKVQLLPQYACHYEN
jgi:hypothetical protein